MHTLSLLPLLLIPAVTAVDIHVYPNTRDCAGSEFNKISNVAANTCVSFSSARSVSFRNMPGGAKGQLYKDACTDYAAEGKGGVFCLNNDDAKAANWFYPW